VVYNGGLRLVKLTHRKCLCRKAFIHRFAHKFRPQAFRRGSAPSGMVNPRAGGPVPGAAARAWAGPE